MRIYPTTTVDQEFKTLGDAGFSGTLNDRQFSFLRGRGYINSLADMMTSWFSYSPSSLFLNNEPGFWYDPSDLTTMFQDRAGTTPVTAPGQSVGLRLDKSKGLVLGPELVTNGNFSAGSTGWTGITGPWDATSGQLVGTAIAANAYGPNQTSTGCTAGVYYKVTYDITVASGGIAVRAGNGQGPTRTVSGSYSEYIQAISTGVTVFQVRAGASGFTGSIDNISVKELPGNHLVANSDAARGIYGIEPFLGRRNLLTYTEQFDNAVWVKTGLNTTATPPYIDVAVSPDGTQNADFMVEDTANSQHNVRLSASMDTSKAYTYSFFVKAAGRSSLTVNRFNSAVVPSFTHTFTLSGSGSSSGGVVTAVGNDWYRCSGSFTTVGAGVGGFIILLSDGSSTTYTGDGTSGIYVWGAQLVLGSTATAYQKVVSQYEVTEAGVPTVSYVQYDGVDDGYVTPTITPGTDKVQVFAGVRKLSDAATGLVTGLGSGGPFGSFEMFAPSPALSGFRFASTGGSATAYAQVSGYAAPITNVITGLGDISGDRATLRVNGTQVSQSTTDQGTGIYNANPVYIGRRGGTTLPFNGRDYGIIVRFGANLTDGQIASTEAWMNSKTGAF